MAKRSKRKKPEDQPEWVSRFVQDAREELGYLERVKNLLRQVGVPEAAIAGNPGTTVDQRYRIHLSIGQAF